MRAAWAVILISCLAVGGAWAAPPANDQCPGAAVIPPQGPFPYLAPTEDVLEATSLGDPPAPDCQRSVSRSVWFAFTPTVSTEYSFSLCSDAPAQTTLDDTVVAVYGSSDGTSAGTLQQIAGGCDDDSCPLNSLQSVLTDLPLSAGSTYYVVVFQYGTSAPAPGRSAIQLFVTQAPPSPPPANDRCEGA